MKTTKTTKILFLSSLFLFVILSINLISAQTLVAGKIYDSGYSDIVSGADVMRPGIVEFDENIKKGDVVIVKEEGYGKPIAIGKALWDGEEFKTKEKGKCVKNLHYIGDKIWKL